MRLYLHIFVLLAFILSGISPACAFVSGKGSSLVDIEICTNDGLKIVKVAADDAPGGQQQEDEHKSHPEKTDCGFCFAQTHLKSAKVAVTALSPAQNFYHDKIARDISFHVHRFELSGLSARAPPLFS